MPEGIAKQHVSTILCLTLQFSLHPIYTLSGERILCFHVLDQDLEGKLFSVSNQDDDPYVRKTAAVCVAKLHDINAELVEDRGFLEALKDMISDSNPMVVANAVASLAEIQEGSSKLVFEITNHTLFKLLAALNECTE